jgi:peptidyl-prolyl cis-trans isomerase A (cyclophilin A)
MRCLKHGLFTVVTLFCLFVFGFAQEAAQPDYSKLLNPSALNETAPDNFQAKFVTTKGTFVIQVRRSWSPNGADRFYNLVKNGYYDNCRIFRIVPGFMMQFGINGDPKVNAVWSKAVIKDDPVKQSNRKGYVSFAKGGPNSRTTQIFINFDDQNILLDGQGFSPFGTLTKGTDIVMSNDPRVGFYNEYLDGPPQGKGPDQGKIQLEGNAYLDKNFPKLDFIKTATIVEEKKKK